MSFSQQSRPALGISAAERETGLGKDTLRVWERRYGFPRPERDANGERLYPAEQVDRLKLIKRLMDQGHRPGRLMAASEEDLQALYAPAAAPARHDTADDTMLRQLLALVKTHDVPQLRSALSQAMLRQGLQDFVLHSLGALNHAVGEAWMSGEFEIFEEHLYTEQVQALLRQAIGTLPARSGSPRILLTTLPEEQHGLGLLMAEALLALDGATCVSLGTQTPSSTSRWPRVRNRRTWWPCRFRAPTRHARSRRNRRSCAPCCQERPSSGPAAAALAGWLGSPAYGPCPRCPMRWPRWRRGVGRMTDNTQCCL